MKPRYPILWFSIDHPVWKYELHRDYVYETGIKGLNVGNKFEHLAPAGTLLIDKGYAWDGPSGPAVDTLTFMRASLVHDALYQLMREEKLPRSYRKAADKIMYRIAREDGIGWIRAKYCYHAVRLFAGGAARK